MLRVSVNGEWHEVARATRLAELLDGLRLERTAIAVELNRQIVSKAQYDATELHDSDRLEIVTIVGGG